MNSVAQVLKGGTQTLPETGYFSVNSISRMSVRVPFVN